jgi:hypothetical protein
MSLTPLPTRIQTRGHCQCCGNQQAVTGTVAKHGYTVQRGWFEGTCPGSDRTPMEFDRAVTDQTCFDIEQQCATLDLRAAGLRSGEIVPGKVQRPYTSSRSEPVEFAGLSVYDQKVVIDGLARDAEYRAKTGRMIVEHLRSTADRVHGQPLAEVEVVAKSGPTVHATGGTFGILCAASRMGSAGRIGTEDHARVTCKRCRAEIERKAARLLVTNA